MSCRVVRSGNILLAIVEELAPKMPAEVKLVAARLQETVTSGADREGSK